MPFIDVIDYEDSEGRLREIYQDLIGSRGKLAEVHKIQSLNPESIVKHMELYMHIMFGKSPLRRYQREMIAVCVSKSNDCLYCITHHAEALQHFWKDEARLERFKADHTAAGLSPADLALCDYAMVLTRTPSAVDKTFHEEKLKKEGLSDRAILDASLVIAYFNFVNRLVLGLGVHLEDDQGKGYAYD